MAKKKEGQSMLFGKIDDSVCIGLNQGENYNITKAMLNELSYGDLFRVFYGLNNISLHHQFMASLNPHEILAVYMGVHDIKYEKQGLHKKLSLAGPENVYDVLHEANSCSYTSPGLVRLKQGQKYRKCNVHSQKKGDLEKRIRKLDYYPKWRFLVDFRMPKKEAMMDFYDPNCDDRGARGKQVYVNSILRAVTFIYSRHMEEAVFPGHDVRSRPFAKDEILAQSTIAYARDVEGCSEN